jgi:hypothetical protein
MRLHGWCESCKRIRMVTVRRPFLGGVPVGVCAACEEAEQKRRSQ